MCKLAQVAGSIIGGIVDNITKIAESDEPICPRIYGLKDVENCNVGCTMCWIQALESI